MSVEVKGIGTAGVYIDSAESQENIKLSGVPVGLIGGPAHHFGMTAKANPAEFQAQVLSGALHTRAPQQANFRAGFHLCYSASADTSVALLKGPSPEANVRKWVKDCVLPAVEAQLKQLTTGRKRQPVEAVGLYGVHVTGTAGGPQLHVHIIIANCGRTKDGRFTCLNAYQLFTGAAALDRQINAYTGEFFRARGVECRFNAKSGGVEIPAIPREAVRAVCRSTRRIEELTAQGLSRRQAVRKSRAEFKAEALANPDARPKSLDAHRAKWEAEIDAALAPKGQSFKATILPALKGLEQGHTLKPPPVSYKAAEVANEQAKCLAKELNPTTVYTPARLHRMMSDRCVGLETTPEAVAFWAKQLGHETNAKDFGLKRREFPSRTDNGPLVVVGHPEAVDAFAKKHEAREARRDAREKAAEEQARPGEPPAKRTWPEFGREVLDATKVSLERAAAPMVQALKTTALAVVVAAHVVKTAIAPASEMRFRRTLHAGPSVDNFIYDHSPEKRSVAHRRALMRGAFARSVTHAEAEYRAERRPDRRLKASTELVVHDPKRELTDKQVRQLEDIAKRDGSKLRLIREPEAEKAREQRKDRTHTKDRDDSRQL